MPAWKMVCKFHIIPIYGMDMIHSSYNNRSKASHG